jgi:NAD(P)-dependent dehydrogenase (short-subunit alcohol dehydrogenase family)
MEQKNKIAFVTGANKGIGFEVARQLAKRGFHVFIGARNLKAGREAVKKIMKLGADVSFLQLDVSRPESVAAAAREFASQNDHLDVLVNNAGILLDGDDAILKITTDMLQRTVQTNTFGPLIVAQAFRPMLAKSSAPRIVNVSSGGGQLSDMGTWAPAYSISKTALNAVTCQLAAAQPKFAVNSVCPGWVRTDMGGAGADRSVEEGADTIVWLAADAPQNLTGKFLRDRKPIPW